MIYIVRLRVYLKYSGNAVMRPKNELIDVPLFRFSHVIMRDNLLMG
jgi:hypothetical protein